MKSTVSRALHELLMRVLPHTMADEKCRSVLRALLYSPRRCRRDAEAVVMGTRWLGGLVGRRGDAVAGARLLKRFRAAMVADGVALRVSQYSRARGEARTVVAEWPAALGAALAEDRRVVGDGRVDLLTGQVWTRRKSNERRNRRGAELLGELGGDVPEGTRLKSEYLSSAATNGYSRVSARAAEMLERGVRVRGDDPARLRQAESVLAAVAEQAAPIARPCERSARVRTEGAGVGHLPRELRAELGRGLWHEYDLTSCQLAVIARFWQVPELEAELRSGRDVFRQTLAGDLGVPAANVPALKAATYAIAYGACKKTIRAELVKALGEDAGQDLAQRFLTHKLVRAVLQARGRMFKRIKADGGAHTVDGSWLALQRGELRRLPSGKLVTVGGRSTRKILAALNQAVEQSITTAAYKLAEQNRSEFRIAYDLADGIAVMYTRHAARWEARIKEAVDQRIRELGLNGLTRLKGSVASIAAQAQQADPQPAQPQPAQQAQPVPEQPQAAPQAAPSPPPPAALDDPRWVRKRADDAAQGAAFLERFRAKSAAKRASDGQPVDALPLAA